MFKALCSINLIGYSFGFCLACVVGPWLKLLVWILITLSFKFTKTPLLVK